MSIPRSAGALLTAATVAFLAGCGGSTQLAPPLGSQPTQSQQSVNQSQGGSPFSIPNPNVTAKPAMLYVSDAGHNSVYGYLQAGTGQSPTLTLTSGLYTPYGIFMASNGNLYVANSGGADAVVFKTPITNGEQPFETFFDNGTNPTDVAVCKDGTMYITNNTPTVSVYAKGSKKITSTISVPAASNTLGVACDKSANVYILFINTYSGPGCVRVYSPGGKGSGKQLALCGTPAYPQGFALLKTGDIALTDDVPVPQIEFYHQTGGSPYKTFSKPFNSTAVLEHLAFASGYTHLYVADSGNNDVLELNAGTGAVLDTITNPGFNGAWGVAAYPISHF